MAAHTLSILRPSVNNLSTRIFVRAAGLEFEELDVWGKKSTPEFLAKDPADLTPLLEWSQRDEKAGLGDMPYPPDHPKMPGEPPRVQPSRINPANWDR